MGRPRGNEIERFWSKVTGGPVEACWIWTAAAQKGSGYASFWADGKRVNGHVWSYEHMIGPVPDGLQLDHVCHTSDPQCPGGSACPHRLCVNPWHLEPVTPLVNTRRGNGNVTKTHCAKGHPYSEANTYRTYDGKRVCRTCRQVITRNYRAARAA